MHSIQEGESLISVRALMTLSTYLQQRNHHAQGCKLQGESLGRRKENNPNLDKNYVIINGFMGE